MVAVCVFIDARHSVPPLDVFHVFVHLSYLIFILPAPLTFQPPTTPPHRPPAQNNYGWISIAPPAGSAAATALAALVWVTSNPAAWQPTTTPPVNNTVLTVTGTLPLLNTAVAHLQWYPWTNYHGLESSFTLTLKDDGCAAAMAPGSGTCGGWFR